MILYDVHSIMISAGWLGDLTMKMLNLSSKGCGFNSQFGRYQVATTWLGKCLLLLLMACSSRAWPCPRCGASSPAQKLFSMQKKDQCSEVSGLPPPNVTRCDWVPCGPSPIRRRLAYRGSNGTMVIFVRRAAGDVTEETEPSACWIAAGNSSGTGLHHWLCGGCMGVCN